MSTVFTADVVDFNFVPEKYAAAQSIIAAEFNVDIETNWQASIDSWFQASASAGTDTYPSTASPAGEANCVLTPEYEAALLEAQTTEFTQGDSVSQVIGISTSTAVLTDAKARDGLKQCLFQILSDAGWLDGTATGPVNDVKTKLAAIFTLLLNNVAGANTGVDRSLSIDANKVHLDMKKNNDGTIGVDRYDEIPDESTSTSRVRQLISAYAFVPVMNRFIAGGNFTAGDVSDGLTLAEGSGGTNAVRQFDTGLANTVTTTTTTTEDVYDLGYDSWASSQPNNSKNREHHAAMYSNGTWSDRRSSGSSGPINSIVKISGLVSSLTPGTFSYLGQYDGNSYFLNTTNLKWADAKTAAEAAGAQLSCHHTQAENDAVEAFNISVGKAWIGLYQDTGDPAYSEPDGAWKWVEPISVTTTTTTTVGDTVDRIPKAAKLVFPVRIRIADDSQTLAETGTTTADQGFVYDGTASVQSVDFQLNIILSDNS